MNKTYEIQYDIEMYPVQSEVVTVDGRSHRQNRLPMCLVEYAQRTARAYGAYRFRINHYLPPHISGSGIRMGVAHHAYEELIVPETV